MPLPHCRLAIALPLLLLILIAAPASAQVGSLPNSSSGSGNSSQSQAASQAATNDIFEVLQSGGDLLIDALRPKQQEPTVDSPRWNSYESPRHAAMTFLEAMRHVEFGRTEAWPRAEKALQLTQGSDLSAEQAAWDLKNAFDHLNEVAPETVPGTKQVEDEDIRRFVLFPDAMESDWLWQSLESPPEGQIVLVQQENGQWAFSETTTAGAEKLAASLQAAPPQTRDKLRGELFLSTFRPTVNDTPWWGWLTLLVGIAGGFLFAWGLLRGVDAAAQRFEARGRRNWAQSVRAIGRPLTMLCIVVGLVLGSAPVQMGPVLQDIRWGLVEVLVLIAAAWLLVEVCDFLLRWALYFWSHEDDNYVRMGTTILRRSLRVAVTVILGLFIIQNLLQINLTAVLGGLGLATLAISLAAKDSLRNVFGALMIFVNRPFLVGDWVQFRDELGVVDKVTLQVTRIRLLSGDIWTVPNTHFTEEPVQNFSMRTFKRRTMDIQIPYDTPPEKIHRAVQVLQEVLSEPKIVDEGKCRLQERPPLVMFDQFNAYSYNLRAYYWYFMSDDGLKLQRETERGWFTYLDHCTLVNQRIVERFEEEGIEFAFPTQTLFVANDPEREFTLGSGGQKEQPALSDGRPPK